MTITCKDVLEFGFEGADLSAALSYVNSRDWATGELETWLAAHKTAPKLPLQSGVEYAFNLLAGNEAEADNVAKARQTMDAVMRTPTVRFGAVMPDAWIPFDTVEGQPDAAIFAEETAHIDAWFFCDRINISELPSVYKPAATVRQPWADFELAEVVDEIMPYGCIMAGDWAYNAPWKLKARVKYAAREAAAA